VSAQTVRDLAAFRESRRSYLGGTDIAAITGAKRTPDLVPLCHPLPLTGVTADVEVTATGARIVVDG